MRLQEPGTSRRWLLLGRNDTHPAIDTPKDQVKKPDAEPCCGTVDGRLLDSDVHRMSRNSRFIAWRDPDPMADHVAHRSGSDTFHASGGVQVPLRAQG
jgi:hypothetical protein